MRNAGQLARQLLNYICSPSIASVGTTTEQINNILHNATIKHGAYPSPLNYMGFPKSVCSSINEVVCHGIPDNRPLELGDVVSFDVSCYVEGVHGDNCATVIVGDVLEEEEKEEDHATAASGDDGVVVAHESNKTPITTTTTTAAAARDWYIPPHKTQFTSDEEQERIITARRLVQAALEARDEGVAACKPGACLTDIGAVIHAVSDAYGYDTVRHYRGHGIYEEFHRAPFVKHFRNEDRMELLPGMIFTIEPMITEGNAECYEWNDHWTVVTRDGGRCAQFEHTVLITEDGVEILTLP
jgi:methionyl aminopeptidase